MRVGNLEFTFEADGLGRLQKELEDLNDKLQRTATISNTLDGKDIDIDVDVDRDGSLAESVETVRTLDGMEVNPDVEIDEDNIDFADALNPVFQHSLRDYELEPDIPGQELRDDVAAALQARDFEVDVDPDLGRVPSTVAESLGDNVAGSGIGNRLSGGMGSGVTRDEDADVSGSSVMRSLRNEDLSENLSRLNDEAFAVASIMQKLGSSLTLSVTGFTLLAATAGTAVTAVGGLAAAATQLASQFGGLELRSSLAKLKGLFQGVARDFVESFQQAGIFKNQLFPAAREIANILRQQIPVLTRFTQENLPSLVDSVTGLVEKIDQITFILDKGLSVFDVLFETVEIVVEAIPAFVEFLVSQPPFGSDKFGKRMFGVDFQAALEESLRSSGASTRNLILGLSPTTGDGTNRFVGSGQQGTRSARGAVIGEEFAQNGIQKVRKIQQEIRAIGRLMEKEVDGEPLMKTAKGLKKQFRLAKKGLLALEKKGLGDSKQFKNLVDTLKRIKKEARKAGVELGFIQELDLPNVPDAQGVEAAPPTSNFPLKTGDQLAQMGSQIEGPSRLGLGRLQNLARSADSVQQINALIQKARNQFNLLENQEAQQFVGRLQKAREELRKVRGVAIDMSLGGFNQALREAVRNAESLGTKLGNAVVGGIDQLSSGIGQQLGGSLFADQNRLNRLRGRRRSIQQNLRQARQAGNVQQIRQLRSELNKVNQKLNQTETLAGRIGRAFKNFGQVAKQALESFVSQLIKAITKMLVFKAITKIFSLGTGGLTSILGQTVPNAILKGGQIPKVASGGFVKESGLAKIHKGETIVPAGVTSAGGASGTLQNAGQARLAGGTIQIPVEAVRNGSVEGKRRRNITGRTRP